MGSIRRPRGLLVALTGLCLVVLVALDGSLAWQLLRALAVALVTWAVVVAGARWGGFGAGLQGAYGMVALAVGIGFVPHVVEAPATVAAVAGAGTVLGGALVVVVTTVVLLRGRSWPGRLGGGALVVVATVLVLAIVSPAVAVTNVRDTDISATPADRGLDHEPVALQTSDGVRLAGWYLPGADSAAVVLRHGAGSTRSGVLDHAEVLVRHGYGVLLVDARGHGDSGGRAMDFGWYGDLDIGAAVRHLRERDDVDPARIGLVGMSMGGEEAIGAAAAVPVAAVVAEGATARTAGDKDWLSDVHGVRGGIQEQIERLQYGLTDLLTDAEPPTVLREAVRDADGVELLLIAAATVEDEGNAAAWIASGAPERVEVWTVADAGHTGGLETVPAEWERRVVAFLTEHL